MIGDPLVAVVLMMSLASLGTVAASQLVRGRWRILSQRYGMYAAVPSITAALVLVPLRFNLSFSDGLSLAGLVLSVGFGMAAGATERLRLRLRVGILIPSAVPFHTELRAGFIAAMSSVRADIYDDYLLRNRALENLTEFLPALRRTLNWRPDYLVVCSPAVALWSNDQIADLLTSFTRRGGGIIFIDNEPVEELCQRFSGRYGMVTSDVETGARLIAEYVRDHIEPCEKILVLCGPSGSAPAELRRRAFAADLPDATIRVADSGAWTEESAYAATVKHYQEDVKFVICGNDVMAFGSLRALREIRKSKQLRHELPTEVIGYDGIARALYAIAMPDCPLAATVRTPPSAYGDEIAAMIIKDSRWLHWRSSLAHVRIPVTEGQLITRNNVEMVLEG